MFFNGEQHNDNGGNVPVEGKFDVGSPFNARESASVFASSARREPPAGLFGGNVFDGARDRGVLHGQNKGSFRMPLVKISITFYVKSDALPLACMASPTILSILPPRFN